MSIKKCCENCALEYLPYDDNCIGCKFWYEDKKTGKDLFVPKERLIREDEREKIIKSFWKTYADANNKINIHKDGYIYEYSQKSNN